MCKKLLFIVLLLVLIPGSVFAQTDTVETIRTIDDLGRAVEIPTPIETVITMAPSLTEIADALGLSERIIATDINSDFPEQVTDLPKVTNWDMTVNYEAILALDPDLILLAEISSIEEVKMLEDLGLTVYYVNNPTDFDSLYETIRTVGYIFGKNEEAEAVVTELGKRVDSVKEAVADAETTPAVFYEIDATDPSKPWTTGSGTFMDDIIELAHGKNIAAELEGSWLQVGQEFLIMADPEIILLGDAAYGVTPESVGERAGCWDGISAVVNDRVIAFDDNLISRPGPRLVDGLEIMAQIIHPECFK